MKARGAIAAAVLAVLLGAGQAPAAEGIAGRFAIAAQVGTQSELGGDLLRSGQATVVNLPVTFDSVRYRDVYAPKLRLQGLIGYGVGERVELVLRGGYYESPGTGVAAGKFGADEMFAYFSDYEEWGLELVPRYYIAYRTRLKSYVAPVVGVRSSKRVWVDYSIPTAGTAVLNVPFHDESTVPVFGLDIGVSFDLTPNLFIGLDSGVRWQGAPGDANGLPTATGVDDSEGRWTAPVMLSLGLRF